MQETLYQVILNKMTDALIKGRGKSSPTITRDNIFSDQKVKLVEILSEGPIEGFVAKDGSLLDPTKENIASALVVDGIRAYSDIENKYILKGINVELYSGDDGNFYTFETLSRPTSVSASLRQGYPIGRIIQNSLITRLSLSISFPSFLQQESDGDVYGTSVDIKVSLYSKNNPTIAIEQTTTIKGKSSGKFAKQINLTPLLDKLKLETTGDVFPLGLIVERLTRDSVQGGAGHHNASNWEFYTEYVDESISAKNVAIMELSVDTKDTQRVPNRGVHVRGRKIRIPSNYDPTTRTYDGIWGGEWKTNTLGEIDYTYSNNPAWCLYDLLIDKTYGLGNLIGEDDIDKWAFYRNARYCDEQVEYAPGLFEPRFTMNVWIGKAENADKLIRQFLSQMLSVPYWGGDAFFFDPDTPLLDDINDTRPYKSPVEVFTNSNVISGEFNYATTSVEARYNSITVTWLDPRLEFAENSLLVEDFELIKRYGRIELQTDAFGVTSYGQARRFAKWMIYTSNYETRLLTFTTGIHDVGLLRQGSVIEIYDNLLPFSDTTGKTHLAERVLDVVPALGNIYLTFTDGFAEQLLGKEQEANYSQATQANPYATNYNVAYPALIDNKQTMIIGENLLYIGKIGTGQDYFYFTSNQTPPVNESAIAFIHKDAVERNYWRIVGIEQNHDNETFKITGVEFNPAKFALIDGIDDPPTYQPGNYLQDFSVAGELNTPINISFLERNVRRGVEYLTSLIVGWDANDIRANRWQITYSVNGTERTEELISPDFAIDGLSPNDEIEVSVYSIAAGNRLVADSDELRGFHTIEGFVKEQSPITNLRYRTVLNPVGFDVMWDYPIQNDFSHFAITRNDLLMHGGLYELPYQTITNTNLFIPATRATTHTNLRITAVDTSGNESSPVQITIQHYNIGESPTIKNVSYIGGQLAVSWNTFPTNNYPTLSHYDLAVSSTRNKGWGFNDKLFNNTGLSTIVDKHSGIGNLPLLLQESPSETIRERELANFLWGGDIDIRTESGKINFTLSHFLYNFTPSAIRNIRYPISYGYNDPIEFSVDEDDPDMFPLLYNLTLSNIANFIKAKYTPTGNFDIAVVDRFDKMLRVKKSAHISYNTTNGNLWIIINRKELWVDRDLHNQNGFEHVHTFTTDIEAICSVDNNFYVFIPANVGANYRYSLNSLNMTNYSLNHLLYSQTKESFFDIPVCHAKYNDDGTIEVITFEGYGGIPTPTPNPTTPGALGDYDVFDYYLGNPRIRRGPKHLYGFRDPATNSVNKWHRQRIADGFYKNDTNKYYVKYYGYASGDGEHEEGHQPNTAFFNWASVDSFDNFTFTDDDGNTSTVSGYSFDDTSTYATASTSSHFNDLTNVRYRMPFTYLQYLIAEHVSNEFNIGVSAVDIFGNYTIESVKETKLEIPVKEDPGYTDTETLLKTINDRYFPLVGNSLHLQFIDILATPGVNINYERFIDNINVIFNDAHGVLITPRRQYDKGDNIAYANMYPAELGFGVDFSNRKFMSGLTFQQHGITKYTWSEIGAWAASDDSTTAKLPEELQGEIEMNPRNIDDGYRFMCFVILYADANTQQPDLVPNHFTWGNFRHSDLTFSGTGYAENDVITYDKMLLPFTQWGTTHLQPYILGSSNLPKGKSFRTVFMSLLGNGGNRFYSNITCQAKKLGIFLG